MFHTHISNDYLAFRFYHVQSIFLFKLIHENRM